MIEIYEWIDCYPLKFDFSRRRQNVVYITLCQW